MTQAPKAPGPACPTTASHAHTHVALSPREAPFIGPLIALGLGSTVVVWGGPTYWALALALMGLVATIKSPAHGLGWLPLDVTSVWLSLTLAFTLSAACSALMFVVQGNRFNVEALLPFLLFPFIAVPVIHARISARWFWLGVVGGAFAALLIAGHQHYVLGTARAQGFMHPIAFGDIAVTFALAATIGATSRDLRTHAHPALIWALGLAALAAGFASLLSGSRGGWLSLLTVAAMGVVRMIAALPKRRRWLTALVLMGTLSVMGTLAPRHVVDRLEEGLHGGITWLQTGEVTDGSVSYRLEMWSLGWRLFSDRPWSGTNRDTLLEEKERLITAGEFSPLLRSQETMDSEWVGALVGGGVVGLLASLLLILVPIWAFRRVLASDDARTRDLALLGVWVPVVFFEFGLSISLWGVSAFRQVYVSWLVLLAALIINASQAPHRAPREHQPLRD